MKKQVTDKIRKLRLEKGISQENVADELGITHSAYAKIERGVSDPNLGRLFELAEIFKVGVIDFFTDESQVNTVSEPQTAYNSPVKQELEKLNQLIPKLLSEIDLLRAELSEMKKSRKS